MECLFQAARKADPNTFDTLNFTPGTEFMQRLKDALYQFAYKRLQYYPEVRFVPFFPLLVYTQDIVFLIVLDTILHIGS